MQSHHNVLDLYRYLTSRWEHPEEALAGKTINGKLVLMGSFDSGKLELIYQNNETEEVDFHKNVQIQPSQFGFLQSAA